MSQDSNPPEFNPGSSFDDDFTKDEPPIGVVINASYGGFGLSEKAVDRLLELGCSRKQISECTNPYNEEGLPRHDPRLVQVVKELGEEASGRLSHLVIEELPRGTKFYRIDEYDGSESVVTVTQMKWIKI